MSAPRYLVGIAIPAGPDECASCGVAIITVRSVGCVLDADFRHAPRICDTCSVTLIMTGTVPLHPPRQTERTA